MLKSYHIEICKRALGDIFSHRALDVIIPANIKQDHIRYQLRHPHFHFDSNAFNASYGYIEKQRKIVLEILKTGKELSLAWSAFGRMTHSVQDFYAHSNYVRLWIQRWKELHPKRNLPPLTQVSALDTEILKNLDLKSGNIYLWDWLAFVPGFYSIALRLAPKDSHTHMNLDHPGRGPFFPYAIEASVKRTIIEYELIADQLESTELLRFTDS